MKARLSTLLSTFLLRQVCNPVLDLDNITKSSAYKSEFNFVPFGKTNGSDKVFSNEYGGYVIDKEIE